MFELTIEAFEFVHNGTGVFFSLYEAFYSFSEFGFSKTTEEIESGEYGV